VDAASGDLRTAAAVINHGTGIADGRDGIERRLSGDILSLGLSERAADHDHSVIGKSRQGKHQGAKRQAKYKRKHCFLHGKNPFSQYLKSE
jgi:hypothetical protein